MPRPTDFLNKIKRIKLSLRQHRTEIVRQIVQKRRRNTVVFQKVSVQDDGKYESRWRAKPSGGLCAVLP